jgi:hypothetical protein
MQFSREEERRLRLALLHLRPYLRQMDLNPNTRLGYFVFGAAENDLQDQLDYFFSRNGRNETEPPMRV